ncbi:hypothetical protein QBC47DRAFT_456148 [Echria macrotheca]|uniref:Uncharacterized protein n=1 Tax=Echria macrotheca TaxID=438768 RepID=A0AAJ0BND3_9PEZI|nr:hypothetical protein QBC47DRAFT_456148 [Echria macrotheca]
MDVDQQTVPENAITVSCPDPLLSTAVPAKEAPVSATSSSTVMEASQPVPEPSPQSLPEQVTKLENSIALLQTAYNLQEQENMSLEDRVRLLEHRMNTVTAQATRTEHRFNDSLGRHRRRTGSEEQVNDATAATAAATIEANTPIPAGPDPSAIPNRPRRRSHRQAARWARYLQNRRFREGPPGQSPHVHMTPSQDAGVSHPQSPHPHPGLYHPGGPGIGMGIIPNGPAPPVFPYAAYCVDPPQFGPSMYPVPVPAPYHLPPPPPPPGWRSMYPLPPSFPAPYVGEQSYSLTGYYPGGWAEMQDSWAQEESSPERGMMDHGGGGETSQEGNASEDAGGGDNEEMAYDDSVVVVVS